MFGPPTLAHRPMIISDGLAHAVLVSHGTGDNPKCASARLNRPPSLAYIHCHRTRIGTPIRIDGRKYAVRKSTVPRTPRFSAIARSSERLTETGIASIKNSVLPRAWR